MFSESLKKIISLVNKTGDGLILYNELNPEQTAVILGLDKYESLVQGVIKDNGVKLATNSDLTSEELTDRINGDISTWKNQENAPYLAEESKNRNPWAIPSQVKDGAEEVK